MPRLTKDQFADLWATVKCLQAHDLNMLHDKIHSEAFRRNDELAKKEKAEAAKAQAPKYQDPPIGLPMGTTSSGGPARGGSG